MRLKGYLALLTVIVLVLSILAAFGVEVILDKKPINSNMPDPTSSALVTSQPSPTPTELSQVDYNAEIHRLFSQAVQKIEQTRNVTLPQVGLEIVSKEWAIQTWGVSTAQADLKNIQRQENIYKALLMLSENESLYQATVDWAGYYMAVVQSGKIYIVNENFNITNTIDAEATLVHELTHILQNSYNIPQYQYGFDGGKARTALTEGDATFTASFIKNKTLTTNQPNIGSFSVRNGIIINSLNLAEFFSAIPQSVSNINYFPYQYGEKFMQALYDHGGWQAINQAFKNPPNSTEQILNPEKYFTGELPVSVVNPIPSDSNWSKIWGTQYGEFFIQNMLSSNLKQSEAEKAATGWGGDSIAYYENSENQYLITWNINWDTYNDAGEFFLAFNNYMKNAGTHEIQFSQWQTNQIYQKISWNQNTNSTLILASTDPDALKYFI